LTSGGEPSKIVAIASKSTPKMKALVQEGSGSADVLHLREIESPVVTDDRVVVKVHAASVNAADYHVVRGALIGRTPSAAWTSPEWSRPSART